MVEEYRYPSCNTSVSRVFSMSDLAFLVDNTIKHLLVQYEEYGNAPTAEEVAIIRRVVATWDGSREDWRKAIAYFEACLV